MIVCKVCDTKQEWIKQKSHFYYEYYNTNKLIGTYFDTLSVCNPSDKEHIRGIIKQLEVDLNIVEKARLEDKILNSQFYI